MILHISHLEKNLELYVGCWLKLNGNKFEKIVRATKSTLFTESGSKYRVTWFKTSSHFSSLDVRGIYTEDEMKNII